MVGTIYVIIIVAELDKGILKNEVKKYFYRISRYIFLWRLHSSFLLYMYV